MKIDTSKWGEFKVEDLFDILKVTNKLKNSDLVDNGSVLVYSSTTENNGIFGKTNKPAEFTISNQIPFYLIFGDHTRSMSIVKNDFSVMDNVKILKPHIFNEYIIQFIITIWKKSIPNLGYARHWTVAKNIQILLPITSDGELDYKYMEEYIKKIENTVSSSLTKIQSAQNKKKEKIDVSCWKEFKVGDFFDIHPTKAYKLKNVELLDNGNSPIVVNSSYNNGIGGFTTQETTEKGNMITFSDTVDANTIFYQPNDFVGYAHVQGLYPIGKFKDCWNMDCLMFFLTIFRSTALTKGFDYGNKFRRDIAKQLIIKLPITSNGEPDWNYMEEYIKKIEETVKKKLNSFYNK